MLSYIFKVLSFLNIESTRKLQLPVSTIKNTNDFLRIFNRYQKQQTSFLSKVIRYMIVPSQNLLVDTLPDEYMPAYHRAIQTISIRHVFNWMSFQMLLFVAFFGSIMFPGKLVLEKDQKLWRGNLEHINIPDEDQLLEWIINHFDIYELLQRDNEGFFIDTMFLNQCSKKHKLGGIVKLLLTPNGFKVKQVIGTPIYVAKGIVNYMTLLSHLTRSHFMISCYLSSEVERHFPNTDDPVRRVFMPTEIGVFDGIARAGLYLINNKGIFVASLDYTYEEQKRILNDYLKGNPLHRFMYEFGGPVVFRSLNLSTEEQNCAPFKQFIRWHGHFRALAERTTVPRTVSLRTHRVDLRDMITTVYMNQIFHNLASNNHFSNLVIEGQTLYFSNIVSITTAKFTSLPWLMLTTDLSSLSPFFGNFYKDLPDDPDGPVLLRSHEIEHSTGL